MKILFITDLYPINEDDNSPRTLKNFVLEWVSQGHVVEVMRPNFLLNNFLRKKTFYKSTRYEIDGVQIYNINYFTPFLFDISDKLPKELDMSGYDLIIAHMPSGIIYANKLLNKFADKIKAKFVCGVHFSDIEVLTNPLYSLYFKKQLIEGYKKADKIASRSHVLQKKFSQILPEFKNKIFVASSGIDLKDLKNDLNKIDKDSIKVITCANLIKRKNIDKLILAINELDGFSLKIIGNGPELLKLRKIASDKIEFLGRLDNEAVLKQMQDSDIFVLPSVKETFGMVYLEAMLSGCIVVCTKEDGIDGILQDENNGFFTEPSIDGIKETLLKIKNHSNLDFILKNSIETIKSYSKESCAKHYIEKILDDRVTL